MITMNLSLTIRSCGDGFEASVGSEWLGEDITSAQYGDTEAEAAMTAIYQSLQSEATEHRNGWKHQS